MSKKKKKEKITYVDDGSTVADMSNVSGPRLGKRHPAAPHPKAKDVWNTYWNAVKMMFTPMLVVICGIIIIYMILAFVFTFLA